MEVRKQGRSDQTSRTAVVLNNLQTHPALTAISADASVSKVSAAERDRLLRLQLRRTALTVRDLRWCRLTAA